MAIVEWLGTGSGNDWATGANWSTGSAPTASDTAIFTTTSDTVAGTAPATAIAGLRIGEGFTGSIGTSASPFNIGATTVVINCPNGSFFGTCQATTMTILAAGGTSPGVKLTNSAVTTLNISGAKGRIEFTGTNGPATVSMRSADFCTLVVPSTCSDHTAITMDSGTIETARGITTATVQGGTLKMTGSQASTTITQSGGFVDYQSSGTVTNLNVDNGTFSLEKNGSTSVTITNPIVVDGTLSERNGMINVTYTSRIHLNGAGQVIPDVGRQVAIS